MKQKNTNKLLHNISLIGFAAGSLSFLLMIPTNADFLNLLAGAVFWLGLLMGLIPQIILTFRRRKWLRALQRKEKDRRWGIICFGKNTLAKVMDIALLISAAALVLSLKLTNDSGLICYFFLCFAVFFFEAHCIFNGKNYNYIITISKENKTNRSKKKSSKEEEE